MKLLKVDTIEEVKEKLESYLALNAETENTEIVSITEAKGRFLAEDLVSPVNIPDFTRSVVDGYAVVAADTFGINDSTPVFLDVMGQSEMGKECPIHIQEGQAVYVPTGGMLPKGADGVVMVEYIEMLDAKTIAVYKGIAPGSGFMEIGSDFKQGQHLYSKGHRVCVKDVGMLSAMGRDNIKVFQKPKVSILSTGDEIVKPNESLMPGQIRDINSYTLAELVVQSGCQVHEVSLIKDTEESILDAAKQMLAQSDLLLISGGSSAGLKDVTANIVENLGDPGVITHGIAMKPGKPTIVGVVGNPRKKVVFGLPGHPMAAILTYKVIVEDYINTHFFHTKCEPIVLSAELMENVHGGEGRETFVFVSLKKKGMGIQAYPIHAKSGSVSQLSYADGYIRIGHLTEGYDRGEFVEVVLWTE